ncbi:MAG: hypothetical protein JWM29_2032, partial [Solirubrobacterales bacterium]|nr:hypothetical protein [Solirubrobacterales bacterium]
MVMPIVKRAALTLFVLPLLASTARAGSYHVYSCRTPGGESAPADGWSGSVGAGGASDVYTRNTCPEHGALVAALGDQTGHLVNTDRATWAFETPASDRLVGATLWRAGDTAGGYTANATYQFWISAPSKTSIIDECIAALKCSGEGDTQAPQSVLNRVILSSAHLGPHVYLNVSCGGATEPEPYECRGGFGDPNGYAAVVYLYAADLTLEQAAGPSAGGVGG